MIDSGLFYLINGFTGRYLWLDMFGIFLAQYLAYLLAGVLIVFLFKDWKKYWQMVFEAGAAALFGRYVIVEIIRFLHDRTRPFVYEKTHILLTHSASSAFPSGHATAFFAISTIVYLYNKKAGIIFFIASFLMGIGRIFTGLHWPLDILGGIVVGVLSGILIHKMLTLLLKKHKIKS